MSTTFASRLTSAAGRDVQYAIVVQGVPVVFTTSRISPPNAVVALAGYGMGADHVRRSVVVGVEIAAKELDPTARRMVGGSCTINLVDDDAGSLLALFTPRKRRRTFVTAAAAAGDLIVEVASTAGTSAPGHVYVDGETIKYDSIAATEYADCTRGAFGSEAQPHFGDAVQGAGVFTTPPVWTGRRVKVIAYFEREDGTTTAALARVIDTFRLEAPPKHQGGAAWRLECSHLSDEVAARKVGSGLRTIDGFGERLAGASGDEVRYVVDPIRIADTDLFVVGARKTFVRVRGTAREFDTIQTGYGEQIAGVRTPDAAGVHALNSITTIYLDVDRANLVAGGGDVFAPADMRHIAILGDTEPAGEDVLRVLTSRLGDGANDVYDALPGLERSVFGDGDWRFGAGIFKGEVDTDAFIDVGKDAVGWSFVIDDEYDLAEVLDSFCLATNSVWLVSKDGTLTVKRLSEERATSALTLDDDVVIGDPAVEFDDADVAPRVRLTCNYDTVAEEFLAHVTVYDAEMAARFPTHDERVDIETRGLAIAEADNLLRRPTMALESVQSLLRTLQKQSANGRVRIPLRCHLDALVLDLGDVVTVDLAVPDMEGNATTSKTARVIRLGPRIEEGLVEVTVELFEQLFVIAPACVLVSRAGAVLTLRTGGPEVAGPRSATPGRLFFAGQFVALYDVSAATYEDATVLSVTDTTVTLTAAPVIGISANVDVLFSVDQLDVSAYPTGTNVDGYGHADFAYQMPDDEGDIVAGGAGATYATRWR
ncbi:MAG: hypothetical protein ACK52I_01595 [Pseudomonadota bacterium]